MGIYQRQERLIAKIDIITEEEKQGKGTVNFTSIDGAKRFASFVTEEYDSENDIWTGKKSAVFDALQKAFANDEWITLFLARVNSEHDVLQHVREAIKQ